MKHLVAALLGGLILAAATARAAEETFQHGVFVMRLQPDNLFLPDSIRWGKDDVELLKPKVGLNHSFTSFEFRTKIYRDENKHIWGGRQSPRFVTDATFVKKEVVRRPGWAGVQVDYRSSYAEVRRTVLFHDTEPRLRIEYAFAMTREVVIHEPDMFGVAIAFDAAFAERSALDGRAEALPLLTAGGFQAPRLWRTLLYPGPVLLRDPKRGVGLLVTDGRAADAAAAPDVPGRLVRLPKGGRLTLVTEIRVTRETPAALVERMRAEQKRLGAAALPYLLVEDAGLLRKLNRLEEAEKALLRAAERKKDWAHPYSLLAGLRRDTKQGDRTLAWCEAGWRMPFNYGYILSGSGIVNDPRLTEAQRRLALFNLLIAVENTVFYPDYYSWAARGFEARKMWAQACAIYRQALWAVDRMPRPQAYREKIRRRFREKIADLEAKMIGNTLTELPPLIPTRPAEK